MVIRRDHITVTQLLVDTRWLIVLGKEPFKLRIALGSVVVMHRKAAFSMLGYQCN